MTLTKLEGVTDTDEREDYPLPVILSDPIRLDARPTVRAARIAAASGGGG